MGPFVARIRKAPTLSSALPTDTWPAWKPRCSQAPISAGV